MNQPTSAKGIRQQFADTILEVGKVDPRLVVMVGDISHFILQPFAQACPGRYYNVGICEPTIVSMAAGVAKVGLVPVVHTIAPFLIERSFEQIKLDFCYHRLGGNIVTVGSAFDYANLGSTHHCYGDFALLKTLEGAEIVYPGSPSEFDTLFRETYANERLTVFRLPAHGHGCDIDLPSVTLGRAMVVSEGRDLTIVATGPQLSSAVGASAALTGRGWSVEVLYIHTIRPLDVCAVRRSVAKTQRAVVVEEHMESGGLGDDVRRVTSDIAGAHVVSVGIPDRFVREYGTYREHCETLGLTAEGVARRAETEFARAVEGR